MTVQGARGLAATYLDRSEIGWTDHHGGQWLATVTGVTQDEATALVASLMINDTAGTARLPANTWTDVTPTEDLTAGPTGLVEVHWADDANNAVDVIVSAHPDRIGVDAATAVNGARLMVIAGHPGVVIPDGPATLLRWQVAPQVSVQMTVQGGAAEALDQAARLALAEPDDPRISRL